MSVMGSRYMGHVSVILHLTVFSPVMNVIAYLGSGAGRWVRGKDGLLSKSEDPSLALQPLCTKWGRAACIALTRMYRRPRHQGPGDSLAFSFIERLCLKEQGREGRSRTPGTCSSLCMCVHPLTKGHTLHTLTTHMGEGERARATSLYL